MRGRWREMSGVARVRVACVRPPFEPPLPHPQPIVSQLSDVKFLRPPPSGSIADGRPAATDAV